ncbi:MAG: glycosyltransferase family 2 protein [Peptococcaceae bacterium]|nr:glycosyltransferase family 2 protein [Candidatus Syntrophopropionicum ammoniitolerans]
MHDILVSISCITYNHEKYIAKAIEGFLMQKTSFQYEILIHDDASTDKTAYIVKEYERKYPKLIKPIYQNENQYSKGVKVGLLNTKRAKGKYLAICEGDDYWTDPNKLQKQVNYMENNPDCTMCFHNANIINENGLSTGKMLIDKSISSRKYTAGELAVLGFIPTASKIYLKSIFDHPPEWYSKSVVGDYPSQLIIASHGYAYYINESMSNYRTLSSGSASERFNKKSTKEKIHYINGFIDILNNFNEYSNYKYAEEIEKAKIIREIKILVLKKSIQDLKDPRYKVYYDELGITGKLKLYGRSYFPELYTQLANVKAQLNKVYHRATYKIKV